MGRRLATAVHVEHPTTREWVVLEPGDEPDDELAAEITNPHAWEDDEPTADRDEPEPDGPKQEESPPFGFTGQPEAEAEPAQLAPRRRRKTADTDE
jgi:hypothetical protein